MRCARSHARFIAVVDQDLLRSIDLFESLDSKSLTKLISQSEVLNLVRGDVLFDEDEVADALYVIDNGRIAISNRSFDGRESMVALLERGDLFGEMSLFDDLGRSAQARALEPSDVLKVPYAPLRAAWEAQPESLWKVISILTGRLRAMDTALADAFFLDVTGRTAKHLLELSDGAEEFELPITQEELAGLVGASRERVNKAISSFIKLGWIEQRERQYTVLKRNELEIRSR